MKQGTLINRRHFLEHCVTAPATVGLGFLATSCATAERTQQKATPQFKSVQQGTPQYRVSEEITRARPPAREPLPGVFTSAALELVYLIKCGDRSVLVDTGFLHNCDAHLANFSAAGIDLETIDAIFTTHFHVDHTAGLAHARKRLRCPVFAHKNNVPIIETGDRAATAAEMPYIAGWRFPYPPCKVDEVIEDGDDITVGSLAFRVVHLPGHTPGCTGYLWDGNLITGDVVFPGGSLGWNDVHWGSNYLDVIDTVKRIADLNPKYLLPTHTAPFPYDPSVTTNAQQGAREMLEGGRSGPIAYTQRAAR